MSAIVRSSLRAGAMAALVFAQGLMIPAAIAQQRVGVDSAVNPDATGIAPGASPRRLVLGQEVVLNERITTGAGGQVELLFVDGSSMAIGPNALMIVDRFRFDPNSGGGTLVTRLSRGLFRFIGGELSKRDNAVTMQTPSATIAIHGGVVLVNLTTDGQLQVIFEYGKGVTVTCLNGLSQAITRPGFEVTAAAHCTVLSEPSRVSPGETAALLVELDGRAGESGGASTAPTDTMVANSGLAAEVSSNFPFGQIIASSGLAAAVSVNLQLGRQMQTQPGTPCTDNPGCWLRPPDVATPVQQATTTVQDTPVIVGSIFPALSNVELGPKDVAAILGQK
jgi:hypothetical protein